jgi:hypothetical protein
MFDTRETLFGVPWQVIALASLVGASIATLWWVRRATTAEGAYRSFRATDRPGPGIGPALVAIGIAGLGVALTGAVLFELPVLSEHWGGTRLAERLLAAWPLIGLAIGLAASATVLWWFRRQTGGGEYRSFRATDRPDAFRRPTTLLLGIAGLVVAATMVALAAAIAGRLLP